MKDLKNPNWIKLKGFLFLMAGIISSLLLILEDLKLTTAVFLAIAVWCFCRFYYFAFYVIERYADPSYRFSGLISFISYALRKR